jgi:histidinol phosphatase-like enzyme
MKIAFDNYDNTLFLDRDGVINRHRPDDYVKSWEEFEFLPGALDTLALISKQFRYVIMVTNQRGGGRKGVNERGGFAYDPCTDA